MKTTCYILLVLLVSSCHYLNREVKDLEVAKDQVRDTINRKKVSTYPFFESCKDYELATLKEQKTCFFNETSKHIYNYINKENLVAPNSIQDTIFLSMTVSNKGDFSLVSIRNSEVLKEELRSLKMICNEAVESIPKLAHPATKNGVDVTITFEIPLLLNSVKTE